MEKAGDLKYAAGQAAVNAGHKIAEKTVELKDASTQTLGNAKDSVVDNLASVKDYVVDKVKEAVKSV